MGMQGLALLVQQSLKRNPHGGAAAHALMPLYKLIDAHVLAATRIHGDDTTAPVMAKSMTDTARLWVYVRDDHPFAGADPPGALFHSSRDRRGEHPQAHLAAWSGILQADVANAARRKSRGQRSSMIHPIALEAGQRLDALFDIERAINGKSLAERVATRQELSAPQKAELHIWLTEQVGKLLRYADTKVGCYRSATCVPPDRSNNLLPKLT